MSDYEVAEDNEPKYVTISRAQHEALVAAAKALIAIHCYVDFEEPLTSESPWLMEDATPLNCEFAKAYEAITALRDAGIASLQ